MFIKNIDLKIIAFFEKTKLVKKLEEKCVLIEYLIASNMA